MNETKTSKNGQTVITLKDESGKFDLAFEARVENTQNGFFEIRSSTNHLVYNNNPSRNLFVTPHTGDDYLLVTVAENGNPPDVKYIHASTSPMIYSVPGTLVYLINVSKEESVGLFWREYISSKKGMEVFVG